MGGVEDYQIDAISELLEQDKEFQKYLPEDYRLMKVAEKVFDVNVEL